jgi:hypothetical protein
LGCGGGIAVPLHVKQFEGKSFLILLCGGNRWFGDPLAVHRRGEMAITGVGFSGRATVCEKTVNTTALNGVFVVRSLTVSSLLALPPCRDTRHRSQRHGSVRGRTGKKLSGKNSNSTLGLKLRCASFDDRKTA